MKPTSYTYNPLQRPLEALFVFLLGAVLCFWLQLLLFTDPLWILAPAGGIGLYLVYRINRLYPRTSLGVRALLGACLLTLIQLFTGCIVNLGMGLSVWDYSTFPYQFLGQICLPISLLYFFLCFPLALICYLIRRHVFLCDA